MYDFLVNIFKESTLINKLPDQMIKESLDDGSILLNKFKKNEIIHNEGEICKSVEIILEGIVVVDNINSEGEIFRITELKKDDLLAGNIVFLDNSIYPMTITASSEVTLAEIEKEKLLNLLHKNKDFQLEFLKLMSLNSMILSKKAKDTKVTPLRQKIFEYLKYEETKQSSKDIVLPYSKKFLAEKFGVQRTSLSRELKNMEKDNIISLNKRNIRIL